MAPGSRSSTSFSRRSFRDAPCRVSDPSSRASASLKRASLLGAEKLFKAARLLRDAARHEARVARGVECRFSPTRPARAADDAADLREPIAERLDALRAGEGRRRRTRGAHGAGGPGSAAAGA